MSQYPECKHGHSYPNIPCPHCALEENQRLDREYMQRLRDEIKEQRSELSELRTKLALAEDAAAELRKDKERLDWLEDKCFDLSAMDDYVCRYEIYVHEKAETISVRQAIDAARGGVQ